MVAELLRLKLRVLAGGFRRPAGAIVGSVIGILLLAGLYLALRQAVVVLHGHGDDGLRGVVIVAGSLLSLLPFLGPLFVVRRQLIEPRALLGYLRPSWVALALLILSLFGPVLLLIPFTLLPLGLWRDPAALVLASSAAPLLFVQALLAARVGAAAGAALTGHRRLSRFVRVVIVVLLTVGLVVLIWIALPRVPGSSPVLRVLPPVRFDGLVDVLQWTPLGALWAAPANAVVHNGVDAAGLFQVAIASVVVLILIWWVSVLGAMRATHRVASRHRRRVPGWFGRVRTGPTGAVAARSFSYWIRDPRYRAVLAFLPIVPVVILLANWIGGIPFGYSVLMPLPLMVLILAWSTVHNDIAYDSTAMWTHLAAQTRGVHDRLGRIVPVLVFGALLIVIGAPLTVWGFGDLRVLPAVLGVAVALLLGGVGVSSAVSTRFPYPAPRPGDAAFHHPEVSGATSGGGAQAFSFVLTILVAAPAIAATVFWLMVGGPWNWIALLAGVVLGLIVLAIGIRGGGASFDRRAPELLAFTMRN